MVSITLKDFTIDIFYDYIGLLFGHRCCVLIYRGFIKYFIENYVVHFNKNDICIINFSINDIQTYERFLDEEFNSNIPKNYNGYLSSNGVYIINDKIIRDDIYHAMIKKLKLKLNKNCFDFSFESLYDQLELSGNDLTRLTDEYEDDPIMDYIYNHVFKQQNIYLQTCINDIMTTSTYEKLDKDIFIHEKLMDIVFESENIHRY